MMIKYPGMGWFVFQLAVMVAAAFGCWQFADLNEAVNDGAVIATPIVIAAAFVATWVASRLIDCLARRSESRARLESRA